MGVNLDCSGGFWYLGGDFPYMMVTFGVLLVLGLWLLFYVTWVRCWFAIGCGIGGLTVPGCG